MMRGLAMLIVVAIAAVAPDARAQQRQTGPGAAQPPATGAGQPAAKPAPPPSASQPSDAYTYQPEGRRDPFLTLIGSGTSETPSSARRGEGPAGMGVSEISVRGIMQSKGSYIAMIQGPDKKTYIVRPGDKLLDGTIKTITSQEIVVIQEVNDPLSLVKTREVHKLLRSIEDAKE